MQLCVHLIVLATFFRWSSAFQSITVGENYNITAGTEVPVKIINDDNDARAVNYTVGLYTTAGNSLICKLVPSLPISTREFTVTIPASVGPSGFYYRLWIISFTNGSSGWGINFPFPSYSEQFYLSSGNGTLTSYEVLGPVPNQFVAEGFYGSWDSAPPCSSYDCWRQCNKQDPGIYEENGKGLAQSGQTFYDQRLLDCLESCPGTEKPLPTGANDDLDVVITTGTGPLPTRIVKDILPDSSCRVEEENTLCGSECCALGVKCSSWNHCSTETVDLNSSPSNETQATTTGSSAGTAPTGKGKNSSGKLEVSLVMSSLLVFLQVFRFG